MIKQLFEEFLGLVEKSTGKSRAELGFLPPATAAEIEAMEAELRGDDDEWEENVGNGLDGLKALLSVSNGHTTKFAFLTGPLLSAQGVVDDYMMAIDANEQEPGRFGPSGKIHEMFMHEYWFPFASYPAEVNYLIDLAPGPKGKRGQILENYNGESRLVIAESLEELFSLVNIGLKKGVIHFGPVEDYEQEFDLLLAGGEKEDLGKILTLLRKC